ncbi:BPI/LBP family protein-like [Dorcoceras hygrometricum]|uniref:BPI/LBP family protein-like n=1 Tax=Dorcoceras hygrometricum TaxID=472368 RepID=A0A2Z7BVB7_9LAMI|nr:BPI/LBP family protein-like [Dorcoceras hygrometricum]
MARAAVPFLLFLIFAFSCLHARSDEEGHIKVRLSNKGLDFFKDLLIKKAESSLVPIELPDIEKSAKIPVVGKVHMALSSIVIETIDVISSTVQTGDSGIVIGVSRATANMSMNWSYSYKTWLLPISVSDEGTAAVQKTILYPVIVDQFVAKRNDVEASPAKKRNDDLGRLTQGMDVNLTLSPTTLQGSLKLDVLDCVCDVKDISIKLDGGASWLYQGLVDAFEGKISSSIENAISKKLEDGVGNINSILRSLPKEVYVVHFARLNITFVDDPELSDSSLDLKINGLFSRRDEELTSQYQRSLQSTLLFTTVDKMVRISLHEDFLKSASYVFFYANKMQWIVDKAPNQSFLNTAGWRFLVPQLYKMYPDDDIYLNLSVSSPPILKIEKQQLKASLPLDVVINVLDATEVKPVACISVVINTSVYAEISSNSLGGSIKLNSLTMSLKWSEIGDLHMHLIQAFVSSIMETLVLPYVNLKLDKGFRLPTFHGYELQDAIIFCRDHWILLYSDLGSVKQLDGV